MSRRKLPAGARVGSLTGLSFRSLRARPLRAVLTTSAIVLGVGMVFGVLLLVGTIHSTFDRLYDSIYGKTDIVVSGERSIGSLPERSIERVRAVEGVASASGSAWSVFRAVDERGRVDRAMDAQIYVVGVDYAQPDSTDAERVTGRRPTTGREIELQAGWAAKRGLEVGDRVPLSTPSGIVELRVVGTFEFGGGLDLGGYGTASMPIDAARPIMDKPDTWDEIKVVVDDGLAVEDVRARLDAAMADGVEVLTPESKGDQLQEQLASFDVVLYFFSGIALFVGAFLILNSFNMTVLQRIRELGTLRALGASRRRIVRSVLTEALVLGVVGSLLGLALGVVLALGLVQAMQAFGMPVSKLDYGAGPVIAAALTGLVTTIAGAAWPAFKAGRIAPVRALIGGATLRRAPGARRAIAGTLLFVPGLVISGLFWFGDTSDGGMLGAVAGIGSTVVMFLGMVLLAPFVVLPLTHLLARPLRVLMPAEGRLAADAAHANPGRTAATAATLLVAISVVVVNSTMASSFLGTISDELDKRFARDLTVQPIGYQEFGPPQAGLSRQLREQIAAMPEAAAVASRRSIYLPELPAGGGEGLVVGYDPVEYDRVDHIDYEGAPRDAVLRGLAAGGVVPSKAYAKAQGIEIGDRLALDGASGTRSALVVGIADTLDGGGQTLQMSLDTMAGIYGASTDSQLAVKATSPEARDVLAERVNALLERDYPGMEALSNAEIKQQTEDAVNQQFGFFNAIVAMAVLVGMLGIVNTLSMSVLERTREIGVLRALGASRWRVRRTMANESLLISIAGTLSGIAAGLVVAMVWIVAMRESTFPGLALKLPVGMLVAIAVLGVVIGVAAAVLPARRAAKLDPLGALRYE
jgi:putative ABC transport system permease protein